MVRPIIPIELIFGNKKLKYEVLVDSGADINTFDAEIADLLGIDARKGLETTIAGITGSQKGFVHEVTIVVGGRKHKTQAAFLANLGSDASGMLGQKGFFDLYKVKFDRRKEDLELIPYDL